MTRPALQAGRRRARGSVAVMTMIFLVLFTSLALAFHASSDLSLRQARNYRYTQSAQMVAESGLAYIITVLGQEPIPPDEAEADLLTAAANAVARAMDTMPQVQSGGGITFDGTTIRTPTLQTQSGAGTFVAEIVEDPTTPDTLVLSVTATWDGVTRRVNMQLQPVRKISQVFQYGIASKGKITMCGDGTVLGVNDANEADILSATFSDPEAVAVTGHSYLAGDISTVNPDSFVSYPGNPVIGGTSDRKLFPDHIHIGVGEATFPEVDTSDYVPLAPNYLDPATPTNSDITLTNIRIPANMNPNFTASVTLRGVIYIEAPNQVTFAGQTTIQGVIVTDDAGDNAYSYNTLSFSGGVTSQGAETLPDIDPNTGDTFVALKQMPGTMMLAPGFGVSFSGNFGTINGAMAADKFIMTGTAGGTICGPIICYGDTEFSLLGGSTVQIDRSKYSNDLPGFEHPVVLTAQGESYTEG